MKRTVWVMMLLAVTMLAMAKPKPSQYGRGTGKVYLFGVSQLLTDSVVYITFINEVDSLDLAKKTKFLPFRSEFSLQLREYMEGTLKKDHQTTTVFFSTNRKKLSKKYYKVKKRFLDNPYTKIVPIDNFRFRHPLESYVNESE
ncbi:MAG: hypothetical protein J6T11_02150 [Bacteroidaceae bacterium]|nr:hypothetical protein [Bacteroidaceae bacterium]